MQIGSWTFANPVFLAPMAGITDQPFRQLCRSLGAGHAISEMTSANPRLLDSRKSRLRRTHAGEPAPIHVQIAGSEPRQMAEAARFNQDQGADIIDINMGCPTKKVCTKLAGSSLLRDEGLVREILAAVVESVEIPVTLKTRTGWDRDCKNAITVATMAESLEIQAMTLHGRTRNDFYKGHAEHDTLRCVRREVSIPLIANGDIVDTDSARRVLEYTGVDAVMIGRGAQERPWLPGAIALELGGGRATEPSLHKKRVILTGLVEALHRFYGEATGLRIARKHIGWQLASFGLSRSQRTALLRAGDAATQLSEIHALFDNQQRESNSLSQAA